MNNFPNRLFLYVPTRYTILSVLFSDFLVDPGSECREDDGVFGGGEI